MTGKSWKASSANWNEVVTRAGCSATVAPIQSVEKKKSKGAVPESPAAGWNEPPAAPVTPPSRPLAASKVEMTGPGWLGARAPSSPTKRRIVAFATLVVTAGAIASPEDSSRSERAEALIGVAVSTPR